MENELNITATGTAETVDTGVEVQEAAEPAVNEQSQQTQSVKTEKDSYFADMRRKQELDRMRETNAQLQQQLTAAQQAFSSYFDGGTLQEQMDFALAQTRGVDVSEIKAEREEQDRVSRLENQLKFYQEREIEKRMEDDLKEIQAIDPTVTSLDDLPKTFLALRFNKDVPMSAKEAFLASKTILQQTKQPKPASTGSMTSTGKVEREFYTSDELDSLTNEQLKDPVIYAKAMKSLLKL